MVVLSQPVTTFTTIKTCKPATATAAAGIPVVDLSDPHAPSLIVKVCQELGFFKVTNHHIPAEFAARLEAEAVKFFSLPQPEKDRAGPPNPFGYGNKKIGPNGDVGWVEYLLFSTNPELSPINPLTNFPGNPEIFWVMVKDYVLAVRKMACELVEMIAEGLKIGEKNVFSRLLMDEKSDSCFRLNHYPPCLELQALILGGGGDGGGGGVGKKLIGFGEHTDPQIISVLRSNSTSGLQISLKDGTWVSVPPDPFSYFINVGDSLQVMTNGRLRSVRHRVLAGSIKSRVSMIYFGGPPLSQKIAPLPSLMEEGEESLYKELTWCEYKKSAYKTRLGDNRIGLFEKSSTL